MALTKITTSVVAVNSLTTANIADNSIDATKIASNSILTRHIDDAQITTDQILDGTIATADIADDAVTEDKLANAINTSIAAKLPLAGGTMTGTLTVAGSGSGTVDAIIITNTDTTNNGLSIGVDSSENAFFWNGSNTSMNFATNNTERMRIDSSGNLLVGATSFNTGAFGATKGINVAHTQPIVLLHETDTDKDGYIGMAASEMFIGTADAIPIRFHTSDAEKMRIDASGNLIMTAGGTIRAGGANDLILDAGESGTPDIYLLSGGSTKVKIEGSNGNVGIGTTSPASKLHIFDGGSSVNNTITFGNPSATPKAEIKHTASGNEFLNISCKGTTSGFGNIAFYTGSTPDERVRINHQGNISFGAQKQDPSISQFFNGITGNYGSGLSMQNNGYAVLGLCNNFFINNSTQNQRVLAQPTQQLQLDHLGNFLFQTAASGTAGGTFSFTERMRLNSSGNLLVGTTSGGVNLVIGGTSDSARIIPATDNVGYIGESTHRWQAIYAVNGSIQTSDEREKTEIKETTLGLDFIKDLKPVSYKWIDGEQQNKGKDEREHQGLIAQQVAETVEKHGVNKNDFGGLDIQKTEKYDDFHGMSYDQFVAPLIKAIQELEARIATLES